MDTIPQWIWPILSLGAAALGSWGAVKISVARLEVQVARAIEDIKGQASEIAQHNDDLRVFDLEMENALNKLNLPRVRRQPLRGWER